MAYSQTLRSSSAAKLASLGGEQSSEFEKSFANLAYAYIKDRSPRLMENSVGFQLVDRNNDNTKALGVFAFRVGDMWLYVPTFFLNGKLKGHELLYVKSQDRFVPLKENWVNHLVSRRPYSLGDSVPRSLNAVGALRPNMQRYAAPPLNGHSGFGKFGQATSSELPPAFAALLRKQANALFRSLLHGQVRPEKIAKHWRAFHKTAAGEFTSDLMHTAMTTNFRRFVHNYRLAETFPAIKQGFDRFYGRDCFRKWASALQGRRQNATAPSLFDKRAEPVLDYQLFDSLEHPVKRGALRVYTDPRSVLQQPDLPAAVRENLLQGRIGVVDKRAAEEVSQAYQTQIEQQLVNPTETGIFSVLEKPVEFSDMLVIRGGLLANGPASAITLIRLGDGQGHRSHANYLPNDVWIRQSADGQQKYKDWFERLNGADKQNLKEYAEYVVLLPDGEATGTFRVRQSRGDGVYSVRLQHCRQESDTALAIYDDLPQFPQTPGGDEKVEPGCAILHFDNQQRNGTRLCRVRNEIFVPRDAKVLRLSQETSPFGDASESSENAEIRKPITLGSPSDVQAFFVQKTAGLTVFTDASSDVVLSPEGGQQQRYTQKEAVCRLICQYGLTEKAAMTLARPSAVPKGQKYRMKYALGFGPSAPYPEDEQSFSDEQYGRQSVRTQTPFHQRQEVDGLQAYMNDPSQWDPWQNYTAEDFQKSVQTAEEAARAGDRSLFDVGVFSTMAKSVSEDSIIDKYAEPLLGALDNLCRLLFMFYWHQEEYADRFGEQSLPELEDALRNAIETLGDVTLFIKEQSVDPEATEGLNAGSIADAAGN